MEVSTSSSEEQHQEDDDSSSSSSKNKEKAKSSSKKKDKSQSSSEINEASAQEVIAQVEVAGGQAAVQVKADNGDEEALALLLLLMALSSYDETYTEESETIESTTEFSEEALVDPSHDSVGNYENPYDYYFPNHPDYESYNPDTYVELDYGVSYDDAAVVE